VPFGEIADITLPKPQLPSSQDPHRGYAYVEFELEQDAKEAIDNLDQSVLFGRVIRVNVAKPQKDDGAEGLNSRTALWQQVSLLTHYLRGHGSTVVRRTTWQSML